MGNSEELFARAKRSIPGGVNSPVRAFGSVGMTPRFIKRGKGDRLWDEEGREYIDYIGSWGPMILGHAHPAVVEAVERAARDGLSFGAATAAVSALSFVRNWRRISPPVSRVSSLSIDAVPTGLSAAESVALSISVRTAVSH